MALASLDNSLQKIQPAFRSKVKKLTSKQKAAMDPNALIKKGIWLYILLLIFEGAFRKWIIPPLSNLFLIARDPLAIAILYLANKRGMIPKSNLLNAMIVVTCISVVMTMLAGHGNPIVALYGARILLFHFPLIFVIGHVFDRNDVLQIGKFMLWTAGPMALLIAAQFYSPQSAWVNKGVGGIENEGFMGAMGYKRPYATFSFTNGTSLFFGFVAPFVVYYWLNPKIKKIVLIAATVGLLMAIPLSISRALFFQVGIVLAFAVMAISRKPEHAGKLMIALVGGVVVLAVLSSTGFFNTAIEVFFSRFDTANESEGGLKGVLGDRYLGGMMKSIMGSADMPFFGYGIGIGTSVGGMLLSGEQTTLIYAEDEWARLLGEMGGVLGLAVIIIRLGVCLQLAIGAYKRLLVGDLLPWLLLGICLVNVPQGQWGQPTALGFAVVVGGCTMASLRNPKKKRIIPKQKPTTQAEPALEPVVLET